MLLEQAPANAQLPITPEEAEHRLHTGDWGMDPALKLILGDTARAEGYEQSRSWTLSWQAASNLYQSPKAPRYWPGGGTEAASIPFFTVAQAVNDNLPQITDGLFADSPPFQIQERQGTTADAARAVGALLGYQLEDINFQYESEQGIFRTLLFGTGIWFGGWESFEDIEKTYKRKEPSAVVPATVPGAKPVTISSNEIEEVVDTVQVERPLFEHIVNLREILVDPTLNVPDIRKAKYVIRRRYLTWEGLDKLRDVPGYTIPSKEELLQLFLPPQESAIEAPQEQGLGQTIFDAKAEPRYHEATIDPFEHPLEVLERWSKDKLMVALQGKLVICNTDNPYNRIPFYSVNWWDVPEAFYGLGYGRTIGNEQTLQQGITNIWLDQATLNLNGVYVRVRGKNIPTQSIRIAPGKIIDVEDPKGFAPLERIPAVPEANEAIGMSRSRVAEVAGTNSITGQGQAGASGHSNLARSSAGAQALTAGAQNPISWFVGRFCRQVFIPWLYDLNQMNHDFLPVENLHYILDEELQDAFIKDGGDVIDLMNAQVKFSVLAGAKMQEKKNMAQSLPLLTQTLLNQQIDSQLTLQHKKIDVVELLRMWLATSGWRTENDLIVDMTPDEIQRFEANSPSAQNQQKMQMMQQQAETKFQQQSTLLDQENVSKAARDVIRHSLESGAEANIPGGNAFGGDVS